MTDHAVVRHSDIITLGEALHTHNHTSDRLYHAARRLLDNASPAPSDQIEDSGSGLDVLRAAYIDAHAICSLADYVEPEWDLYMAARAALVARLRNTTGQESG